METEIIFLYSGETTPPFPANLSPDADAAPDLSVPHLQDPEDPDFSGVVDFSSATLGPDGSLCVTNVHNSIIIYCHSPTQLELE